MPLHVIAETLSIMALSITTLSICSLTVTPSICSLIVTLSITMLYVMNVTLLSVVVSFFGLCGFWIWTVSIDLGRSRT
jgi:hypothetical protein